MDNAPNSLMAPFAAPPPPPLTDAQGRPLRTSAPVFTREIAGPTLAGIRSIQSGHPAQGLTPARLAQLLRAAETGNATAYLELAEEMEEKDLHYQSVMGTRKRAVAQLPIEVEAASEDPDDEKDAQLIRDWLKRLTLQAELFDILDAIGKGYSATEIIWETTADAWLPCRLKRQDPRFFEFDSVTGEQLLLKGGLDGSTGLPQMLPPNKFIVHQAQAKSGLPIRGGLARAAAWGYLFKNFAIKDWMAFLEVYGLPLRVGKYANGTSEDDIRRLEQAVSQIGSDAGAVIPQSMMLEFITTGGAAANPEMFERKAQYIDDALSKAVLGQTSSADAKSGGIGSGQADLHGEVRHDIETADAVALSATLTRDLARPMVMFNRGQRKCYPLILVGRPDPVDVKQALESMAKAVELGVPVAVSTFRKLTGLPEPKAGEELLTRPGQNGPQDGADAADGGDLPNLGGPALLDPLKSQQAGKRGATKDAKSDDGAIPVAAAVREPVAKPDAIDGLTADALGDWQGLMEPLLGSFDDLIAAATSMEEVRELLAIRTGDMIANMDIAAIVELGERAGFATKIAGLIEKPGR